MEKVWILLGEDDDGWGYFEGAFKSKESALKFAQSRDNKFLMELLPSEIVGKDGRIHQADDCFDIVTQKPGRSYKTILYEVSLEEVNE